MRWVARILAGLVAVVVFGVLGLLIVGRRREHGHIAGEVDIDRPASQVFRWMTTEELLKKWILGLAEMRQESAPLGGSEVGSRFHVAEVYDGDRIDMEMEVVKFERDKDLLIHVASVGDPNNGFRETAEYRLMDANGKTRVQIEAKTEYYGYVPRLFEPIVTRSSEKKLRADLNRLKTLVEAEPSTKSGETAKPGEEVRVEAKKS